MEKKYPIYKFWANWDQDGYEKNSTGSSKMYPESITPSQARYDLMKWWNVQLHSESRKDKIPLINKNPVLKNIGCKFVEHESWCLNWFNHYTYNTHLSDEELIKSFEDFVDRKSLLNTKNGHWDNQLNFNLKTPYYCLMGAEQRWRWKGPCHCKHCQKKGLVNIDH